MPTEMGTLCLTALLPPDACLWPHWPSGSVGRADSLPLATALRSPEPVEVKPEHAAHGLLEISIAAEDGGRRILHEPVLVPT